MDFPKQHIETLWSPWRVEYFQQERDPDFILHAANAADDAAHLVVARRKASFLIMNRYPYAVGHLMAIPYRRVSRMHELAEAEALDLWRLCIFAQDLLSEVVKAQGFNVGVNLGKAGGAGIEEHLHFHIVPRWSGDWNFMPVLGATRIIPEGLEPLYRKLIQATPLVLERSAKDSGSAPAS